MPAPPPDRLDLIEAQIAELRELLDPQALRDRMEYTWNPRGTADELRVISTTGAKLPLIRKTIQFLGGVTDDPANDRYVVAAGGGGGGGMAGDFSPDATTTDTERIKFSEGATNRYTIDTATFGTTRLVIATLADDVAAPTTRALQGASADPGASASLLEEVVVAGGGSGSQTLLATAGLTQRATTITDGAGATVSQTETATAVPSREWAVSDATDTATGDARPTYVRYLVNDGTDDSELRLEATLARLTLTGQDYAIMDSVAENSAFMRVSDDGASPYTYVRRITRGAYSAAPGALAAGATATVTVSNALFGNAAEQAVIGHITGAAGVEWVQWSWVAGPGANQVTISFTNTHASSSLTATLPFYTICDA